MLDVDKLRLAVQAALALAVLVGGTVLALNGTIAGESVVALYSVALGAVGAGAVGGARGTTTTTTHTPNGNHGSETSVRKEQG